jgi:hypothetical protein
MTKVTGASGHSDAPGLHLCNGAKSWPSRFGVEIAPNHPQRVRNAELYGGVRDERCKLQ